MSKRAKAKARKVLRTQRDAEVPSQPALEAAPPPEQPERVERGNQRGRGRGGRGGRVMPNEPRPRQDEPKETKLEPAQNEARPVRGKGEEGRRGAKAPRGRERSAPTLEASAQVTETQTSNETAPETSGRGRGTRGRRGERGGKVTVAARSDGPNWRAKDEQQPPVAKPAATLVSPTKESTSSKFLAPATRRQLPIEVNPDQAVPATVKSSISTQQKPPSKASTPATPAHIPPRGRGRGSPIYRVKGSPSASPAPSTQPANDAPPSSAPVPIPVPKTPASFASPATSVATTQPALTPQSTSPARLSHADAPVFVPAPPMSRHARHQAPIGHPMASSDRHGVPHAREGSGNSVFVWQGGPPPQGYEMYRMAPRPPYARTSFPFYPVYMADPYSSPYQSSGAAPPRKSLSPDTKVHCCLFH